MSKQNAAEIGISAAFSDFQGVWLLSDFDQFCDAASSDPFGDEEISVWSEAGIVWVDELPILPLIRLSSQVFDFIESFDGASQAGDDFVLLIQQRDAGFQFGYEHQVSLSFDVCRQSESGESFAIDSVH